MGAQLGEFISRTNKLFTAVFDANAQAVYEASEVMKDLGFVVSLPWSPLVTPIKVPKKDKLDMEAAVEDDQSIAGETGATGATGEEGSASVDEISAATGAAEE